MTEIIPESAMDRASVAPPEDGERPEAQHPDQQAGQDTSIAERLEADPADEDAKLDAGLDESMDASDPPSLTQPGRNDDLSIPSNSNPPDHNPR